MQMYNFSLLVDFAWGCETPGATSMSATEAGEPESRKPLNNSPEARRSREGGNLAPL